MTETIVYGYLALGLASALVAGVFQSFSDFVMAGLARAEPAGGIESMQQLNRTVFRSVFLATFLALVPITAGLAFYAVLTDSVPARGMIVAAGLVYVPSVFLVTMLGNVPMNERLDRLEYSSSEAREYWLAYQRTWTRWNHVRTLGSAFTALLLLLAAVEAASIA